MKNKFTYCLCGQGLIERENLLICSMCHSVFKVEDDKIKFLGNTEGIRETRELLEV